MRGVVSLAAALSIPLFLSDGTAFPQRNLILFITFTVILLTLVVQGLTLPLLVRWLDMKDPDNHLPEDEQVLLIRKSLSQKSLELLKVQHGETLKKNQALQSLQTRLQSDQSHTANNDASDKDYRRVYLHLLDQQRTLLFKLNKRSDIDEDIIRKFQGLLDLEEEKIRSLSDQA
jgi:CPA1 family monovalent cation:H+ antiporter